MRCLVSEYHYLPFLHVSLLGKIRSQCAQLTCPSTDKEPLFHMFASWKDPFSVAPASLTQSGFGNRIHRGPPTDNTSHGKTLPSPKPVIRVRRGCHNTHPESPFIIPGLLFLGNVFRSFCAHACSLQFYFLPSGCTISCLDGVG